MGKLNFLYKIALIEFDYHPEVLRNTLAIFEELDYYIVVYTTTSIWEKVKLPESNKRSIHLVDSKGIKKFVLENIHKINECDLIFFDTLASNFKLFSGLDYSSPVILRVHNANANLNPLKSIKFNFSLFYMWKHFSYVISHLILKFEHHYRTKFIRQKVNYFSFPTDEIKEYVIQQGFVSREKTTGLIPFVYHNKEIDLRKFADKRIKIAVVGSIDKRRRDYSALYKILKQLISEIDIEIELKLLGRPVGLYGNIMLSKYKKINISVLKLITYKKFVPQDEFIKHIEDTDFLIMPIPEYTYYKIYLERYGKTKISGNINDMINYNKPSIIPDFYPLPNELEKVTLRYNSLEGLKDAILNWIETKEFENLSFKKINEMYSKKSVAEKIDESIMAILGSELKTN